MPLGLSLDILSFLVYTGRAVVNAFLSPNFRTNFSRILVLTRSGSSDSAKSLASAGAEVVETQFETPESYDGIVKDLANILSGVHVVINVLGSSTSLRSKNNVAAAAMKAGAAVYFPSEFGWYVYKHYLGEDLPN